MCAPPPRSAPGLGVRTPTRCPWCVPGSDRVSLGGPLTWRNRPFACDRPQRRLSHVTPGPLAWVEVGHPRGAGLPSAQSAPVRPCPLQRPPALRESRGGGGLGSMAGPGWKMPRLCLALSHAVWGGAKGWGGEGKWLPGPCQPAACRSGLLPAALGKGPLGHSFLGPSATTGESPPRGTHTLPAHAPHSPPTDPEPLRGQG